MLFVVSHEALASGGMETEIMEIENIIRYTPRAVELMEIEK